MKFDPAHLSALGASVSFALASMVFTHFSRKISVLWMNCMKALIACAAFGIAVFLSQEFQVPAVATLGILALSGVIGFALGDLCMLRSFASIGPARTLMIYSFEPLLLGLLGYALLGQGLSQAQVLPIVFLILCTLTLSYDGYRKSGRWVPMGLAFAFGGLLLETTGVLLTRHAFDTDPTLTLFQANFTRCLSAVVVFGLISFARPIHLAKRFYRLSRADRLLAVFAAFLGTFVSLWLWLGAIQKGHLASVAAIGGTGPVFATIFECIVYKKLPSPYLLLALAFFLAGFLLLIRA
jgi:drug/metabolite transporter (DMT)-like permease